MTDGLEEQDSRQPHDDAEVLEGNEPLAHGISAPPSPVPPPIPPVTRDDVAAAGPSRPSLWASLVYALATLSLGFPAFAGKFLAGEYSDQFVAGYAFREYGAAMLASGT